MPLVRTSSTAAVTLLSLLLMSAAPGAQSDPARDAEPALLFAPAPSASAADRVERVNRTGPRPRRSRPVTVRLGVLRDLPLASSRVQLNLFDDIAVSAIAERVEARGPASFTWYGRLVDGASGEATFVTTDGVVAGTVFTESGVYEVGLGDSGVHEVSELDPMAFPSDDPAHDMTPPPLAGDASDGAPITDSAAEIDVMVVWTPAARSAAGGTSAIQSLVDLAVANTNTAYANSNIPTRIRLVYKGEVAYTESAIDTDLERLTSTTDGHMEGVHALRDQFGADIVTLMGTGYTTNSGACGIGWLMSSVGSWFASRAFNVVDRACAAGNLSYAHELGHNQGMHHDPPNAGTAAYPYAYGYVDPACSFRTVLAYGSCPRVMHFSSPVVYRSGRVTGTPVQDNARALAGTALTVANFRPSLTGSCAFTLSGVGSDVSASGGTLAVTVTATAGCAWTAASQASWITVAGGAGGTASGTVSLVVAPNQTISSRTGTVTIAGQTYTITQGGQLCAFALDSLAGSAPTAGGTLSVGVAANDGCGWVAASQAGWIAVTAGASGTGTGLVSLRVAANTSGSRRTASVTIAGYSYSVVQAGASPGALASARWKADFAAEGHAAFALWEPSTGTWTVRRRSPSDGSATELSRRWGTGASGDVPVSGDYDGDGRTDFAVWRPHEGAWYILRSTAGYESSVVVHWGAGRLGDIPVPGDYDGDGRTDIAVWRPAEGFWYVRSSGSHSTGTRWHWGSGRYGDLPVPGDYDGDGRTDLAVWRPSTGTWFIRMSSSEYVQALAEPWGSGAYRDVPLTGDFDGDGRTDLTVWRPGTGTWFVRTSSSGYAQQRRFQWGSGPHGDVPVALDYDGDGVSDIAVWRPAARRWYVRTSTSDFTTWFEIDGNTGTALPVR